MKNLVDVYEKLSLDSMPNIGHFPAKSRRIPLMIKFLTNEGFVPWTRDPNEFRKSLQEEWSDAKVRGYMIDSYQGNINLLWFADTTHRPISKVNPIFFYHRGEKKFEVFDDEKFKTPARELTIDEWIERINKRFGWK